MADIELTLNCAGQVTYFQNHFIVKYNVITWLHLFPCCIFQPNKTNQISGGLTYEFQGTDQISHVKENQKTTHGTTKSVSQTSKAEGVVFRTVAYQH